MQFTDHRYSAKFCDTARMVILWDIFTRNRRIDIKGLKNSFNVALHVVKIKLPLSVVNRLLAQRAGRRKHQYAVFRAHSIHFTQLEELQITNPAMHIPLDGLQDTGCE